MRKLAYLILGLALGVSAFSVSAQTLRVITAPQGGTGIGSAVAGDVGKFLKVSDDSPFTYILDSVSSGSPFPFTVQSYGVSTSTTIGLLNGFLSTASSTFTSGFTFTTATGTSATTTNFFSTTASSTNLFSSLLTIGGTNGLTYTSNRRVGVGTSTPWGYFSINPSVLGAGVPEFVVGSSTDTHFIVDGGGHVAVGGNSSALAPFTIYGETDSGGISRGFRVDATALPAQRAILGSFTYKHTSTNPLDGFLTTAFLIGNTDTTNNNYAAIGFSLNAGATTAGAFGIRNVNHASPASDIIFLNKSAGTLAMPMTLFNTGVLALGPDITASYQRLGQKFDVNTSATYGGAALNTWSAAAVDHNSILDFNRSKSSTVGTYTLVADGDSLGQLNFRGADGTAFQNAASIKVFVDGTPGASDMPGRIVFSTASDGSVTLTERMRIDSDGNIGIGTSTPTWLLNPFSSTASQLSLSAGAGFGQWAFRNAGGNFYLATTTVAGTATSSPSALTIIGSSGRVGIGTTTPTSLFQVHSNATTTISFDSNHATKGTCIEMKDSDGSGYTYLTANNGVLTASTVSCK